jgi:hypothetical protein
MTHQHEDFMAKYGSKEHIDSLIARHETAGNHNTLLLMDQAMKNPAATEEQKDRMYKHLWFKDRPHE